MPDIKNGEELLDNYKGNLTIETTNTTITILDTNNNVILPGNKVLPIGEYVVEAQPYLDYNLSSLVVNGNSILSNDRVNVGWGENLIVQAESDDKPLHTPVSYFTIDTTTHVIKSYTGPTDIDIIVPSSYSLKTETITIGGEKVYLKEASEWGSSVQSRFTSSYVNSMTISDGTLTKTFTDYYALYDAMIYEFDRNVPKYIVSFNFNDYTARTLFNSTSTSYNFVQYPFTLFYNGVLHTWSAYNTGTDSSGESGKTLASWFSNNYVEGTDCFCGGLGAHQVGSVIEGKDYFIQDIESNVFKNTDITSIRFPGTMTTISGWSVCNNCNKLETIVFEDGITSILGANSFEQCDILKSITFPNTLNSCAVDSLSENPNLEEIKMNSGGNGKFKVINNCLIKDGELYKGCANSVIPNDGSITEIAHDAFEDNEKLKEITIPSSVKKIWRYAFKNCIGLQKITCLATTPPTLNYSDTFANTSNCPIYVPTSSVSAYKSAQYWSGYASRIYPLNS